MLSGTLQTLTKEKAADHVEDLKFLRAKCPSDFKSTVTRMMAPMALTFDTLRLGGSPTAMLETTMTEHELKGFTKRLVSPIIWPSFTIC